MENSYDKLKEYFENTPKEEILSDWEKTEHLEGVTVEEFIKTLPRQEPSILRWVKKMFEHSEEKEWFEVYFAIDVHGTISVPDFRKDIKEIEYYPYAKETLKLMSEREDIIMIMSTSSYPEEIKVYQKQFKKDGINFKYINENPEISSDKGSFGYYKDKYYFNLLIEDKSGFEPLIDWKFLYDYFSSTKYRPDPKWNMKYKETYHKN